MKVVAIVGSPRPKGNNDHLVEVALEEIRKAGIETEKIILTSRITIKPCLGHVNCATYDECRQRGDDAGWILDKFYEADGVILATPVYYYGMTSQMKAFVDRNYFPYKKKRKIRARSIGLVVIAQGSAIDDTVRNLKRYLRLTSPIPEEEIHVLEGFAYFPGDTEKNEVLRERARQLGRAIAADVVAMAQPAEAAQAAEGNY